MRESGIEYAGGSGEQHVHDGITYLDTHDARLNFANALRLGLPIGTGKVEESYKGPLQCEDDRVGSRWKENR